MPDLLCRLAATWTALGLASGLGYRELTRRHEFTGETQLAVVHTHLLALGTLMALVLLVLDRTFALGEQRLFRAGVWTWAGGLALTAAMLATNGTLTVLGRETSAALAGAAGLGHVLLAAAFVLLLTSLGRAVRADRLTHSAACASS